MREFIEDAENHRGESDLDAPRRGGRDLPKRFFKVAGTLAVAGGFAVTLDGRTTRTPGRVPVVAPTAPLAEAMAAEWAAQGEFIDPLTMPLVRLVNAAVESGEARVDALRAEVTKYAGNDLLLYRAEDPPSLVEAQEAMWDPILVTLARHFDVSFQPTRGIIHQAQPPHTLTRLAAAIEDTGLLTAAALNSMTSITGSGLLAIGYLHQLLSRDEVWTAANLDEDYQRARWGEVEEATIQRARRLAEFGAAVRVIDELRDI